LFAHNGIKVGGGKQQTVTAYQFSKGEREGQDVTSSQQFSLYCDKHARAKSFFATSDRRIKKNIVDISDNEALEKLRLIKPKKYEYINENINQVVYGYIAQEISEIMPYATCLNTDYIPNVYNIADVSMNAENKYTLNINNYDTANLDPSSTVLKIFDGCFNEIIVNIDSIVDGSNIVIKEDISYADLHDNRKVFVHGQEVDDFHILNKEHINVITLSALQELDRQFTQLKQENETLQTELSSIKNRLDALESAT